MDLITYTLNKKYTDRKVSELSTENITAALGYTPADKKTVDSLSEEIGDVSKLGISAGATEILFEKELVYEDQGKVRTYPLVLTAGTTGVVEYTSLKLGQLVVKTMKDGADADVIMQLNPCEYSGSVEFTLTKDCDTIKLFMSGHGAHITLKRKSSGEGPIVTSTTIVDAVLDNKNKIAEINAAMDADPLYPYDVLGESMLASNARYNPTDFMRIVMLDNNYKFFSVANIKRIIDQMAAVSLNYLEIGFGGSGHGNCFQLDDMTVTANGETYDISNTLITNYGKTLTETDMAEIITYAASKGIGIIPALNMPGHMSALLNGRSEFWYKGNSASLDINSDKACNFAIAIAKKYGKWFAERGCKFYNLCADEFYDALNGYQSLHAAGDYKYADFINRLAYELSKYRLSLLCWNDPICIGNDSVPHINRELLVSYWEKREGFATAPELVEQGYNLINSSAAIYWVANDETSVTETKMRDFQVTGFRGGATVAKPVGAKFCIWIGKRENPSLDDDGAAITETVLPLITAFGETIAPQIEALNT